ncbi:hypothetical protein GBA52_014971 [Prunus armeniaca]|nr:hypothetical protein GBA52_014971 [Prunus armeniaca]
MNGDWLDDRCVMLARPGRLGRAARRLAAPSPIAGSAPPAGRGMMIASRASRAVGINAKSRDDATTIGG